MNKGKGTWRHQWVIEWINEQDQLTKWVSNSEDEDGVWESYKSMVKDNPTAELQERYVFIPYRPEALNV